mmetsp:Transcript_16803/g.25401  ORF Transcript_16803/g.25401 Transcript_16803/m.25401 type:complete len:173 (+) Transcript_16803:133-651(+)|eukprot:CAMPEP_0178935798 /NCGR_PEP_ID=MMETSP0786-20121207/24759_1 /TAXON_ID=186022 /ORGANISM="Thalassionema frauenfeldii, Strain CCMP 1798" /LENGTH=172 /DNA_ID=CAMNT_0020614013 /DNA_START=87 /DNA_END=608 /DNA_ORIENTATION=-
MKFSSPAFFIASFLIQFACSTREEIYTPCLQANITSSNGYTGTAFGYVIVCFDQDTSETSGELMMRVEGLTPNITDGGVHIYSGMGCGSSEEQGGHWWNAATSTDPWFENPAPGTRYEADTYGVGSTQFNFDNGFFLDVTEGKPIVIHESHTLGYGRIACGILEKVQGYIEN